MQIGTVTLLAAAVGAAAASPAMRPVQLSKRQGQTYPAPNQTPPQSMTPQAWLDALHAADAAGLIPKTPQSLSRESPCTYPTGVNPADASVCSWSGAKCEGKRDIVNAPAGHIAMNFDDGPAEGTPLLMPFLEQHKQSATHFLIGSQILNNPDTFQSIAKSSVPQHLAVHTWSHPGCIVSRAPSTG